MNARSVLKVALKKLHPGAIIPKYQTAGAAGFDLHAVTDGPLNDILIYPGETLLISTGIAVSIDNPEWGLFLFGRSGLGKKGIGLGNGVGVIDSDYQGELGVLLKNSSDRTFRVVHGDRIAQGVFMPVSQAEFVVVSEFSSTTERGARGFGSTGVGA